VDECYGCHQVPNFNEGEIRSRSGPVMAGVVIVKLTVRGQGGHGSLPHKIKDAITTAAYMLTQFHSIQARSVDAFEDFIFTICQFKSGSTHNVFPDTAFMQGTIRYFNQEVCELVIQRITKIAQSTADAHGCTVDVDFNRLYPALINHEKEAGHVERLAKTNLGEEWFVQEGVPMLASEDFSYFIQETPGAFFFLGTGKPEGRKMVLHDSKMDFNDDCLATGAHFWVKLVEDRLGVKLLNE